MEFVLSNLERGGFYFLVAGAALFVVAVIWLIVTAFRGAKTRGPLILFLLGCFIALVPLLVMQAHRRVVDLGRVVRVLNGDLQIGYREPGDEMEEIHRFKAKGAVTVAGLALAGIGFLWLLGSAFRQWSKVKRPVLLLCLGVFLLALPFTVNYLLQRYLDLGPRERYVNGELHITLTGWDGHDYSILRFRPNAVVVQMANPDVNDETMQFLSELDSLRALDISNTRVTDAGLVYLEGLPIESLRVGRTSVTNAGFRDHLTKIATLKNLDLSGTGVTGDLVKEWRDAKPGRKALR